jgi:predicted amidohydrolase YtcJ
VADRPPSLLIRRAEVEGRLVDVACAGGVITHVGDGAPDGADLVVDAGGGALLPGLHDHHVHLLAMAAARASVVLGPPAVTSAASFDAVLRAAAARGDGWVRGVGYHESIAGPLDRHRLDALTGGRPTRVQHRTGQLWVLNSVALAIVGIAADDGRLYRMDDVLRGRIAAPPPDIAAAAAELAAFGITGVCDMTPATDRAELDLLAAAARAPGFPLRVAVTGAPALAELDVGLPRGPVKVVLDEDRLPPIEELVAWFRRARSAGRPIAVHCVTRVELLLALAAWDEVGGGRPGDRVEHAAVVPLEVVPALAERGLVVVTQPSFITERGDQYLADVDPDDQPHLWRCGSLLEAGIGVAAGSDAPFGDPDPWRAIVAAGDRTTRRGVVLGAGERVTPGQALAMYLAPLDDPAGAVRRVLAGRPADLCLVSTGRRDLLADPAATEVVATVRSGFVRPLSRAVSR